MTSALDGTKVRDFTQPEGLERVTYCVDSGQRATAACPRTSRGWTLADPSLPSCKLHRVTTVSVPDLSGMTRAEAQDALTAAGLKGAFVTADASAEAPAGTVVRQTPEAGGTAKRGSKVTVVLAAAARPAPAPDEPAFSVAPAEPRPGVDVTFKARGAEGSRFTWDFGDGTSAEGARVTHAYADLGDYTVVLTAVAPDGTRAEVRRVVTIR